MTASPVPAIPRRLAAVVALAAPFAALAVSVAFLSRQWDDLATFVACAALIIVAAWYTLTRRGPVRYLAMAAAVLLALLILLLGLSLFLLQAALLVVFAVAGRYALGAHAAALFDTRRARTVGPARFGVLLINPKSGDGKATRFDLAGEARRRGVRPIVLEPGDDLVRLAEQAVAGGADVLGMAGGDGSQALVASVAMRSGVPFVCVPAGTRNHFALDLGLDREDVVRALDAYPDAVERTVDLAAVNDRVFVNNASLGVYAQVVQSADYRRAKALTWNRMLPVMLGPGAAPPDLEFDGPDAAPHRGLPLVLVSNNPYRLTRVGRSGGRPRLDTGRLGVLAGRVVELRRSGLLLRPAGGLLEWSAADFEVRSSAAVPVGVDGEALLLTPPLRFVSLPGALRVRVPRRARGARRRFRNAALHREDLTALARIATGRPPVAADTRKPSPALAG